MKYTLVRELADRIQVCKDNLALLDQAVDSIKPNENDRVRILAGLCLNDVRNEINILHSVILREVKTISDLK